MFLINLTFLDFFKKYVFFLIKLAFIPKDALKTNSETFRNWFYSAISYGKIISLPDYLKNPAHYHTLHYSHEVDSITLGDPSRKFKLKGDS